MYNIVELTVTESATIREALRKLDASGASILLVVDDQKQLRRTVTDGDIRRLLLSGASLDDRLLALPKLTPQTITPAVGETEALEIMTRLAIDHLPVLNEQNQPIAILRRRDLDTKILLSTPHIGRHEWEFVEQAFSTNWIAPLGPNVDAFDKELAAYAGAPHAAAVNSGTAAIHLGLDVMGVGAGDTVFCSTLTFVASANPILYLGARPVFIDSEPGTWNMSPTALAAAMADADRRGQLPQAVVVVNLFGQSADMDALGAICARHGVPVLEDAAESLGATYKDRQSGI
ncbi:MAG TPA: DegT/DnrJ/EryC1/StrS family aminotransferase, partial [Lacunisphaera sp.]|nr:DegT/DnrJ/EryC1/StrS family aminotransferase [Lacunisphaera sp.]